MRGTNAPRRGASLALFTIFTVAILAFAGQAPAGIGESSPLPSISSDKADYAPGDLVTLNGSSWAAGEAVHVVVNDSAGETWRHEADVVAAADGTFSHRVTLPDWFVATYNVVATGQTSGSAMTTFTDGNVNVRTVGAGTNQATITWARFSGTSCSGTPLGSPSSGSFSAGTGGNGTGVPSGVDAGASLRLTAGTISGFSFSSWTGDIAAPAADPPGPTSATGNPICIAGRNNTRQIQVNYVADAVAPTAASISINGSAAWTNSSTGGVTLDLSASDNVGVSRYRLAETQAGLDSAANVAVSPAEASFSRSGVAFTLTGLEGSAKAVWLRVCDAANNCADASDTIGWDKTAPQLVQFDFSPAANAAGWHNTDITVRFSAKDTLSGLNAACLAAFPDIAGGDPTQSKVISTEGNPVSTSSDSCTDVAGNTAPAIASDNFKLDKTAPSVVVSLARGPDQGDWYNAPIGYSAVGSDTLSGVGSCQPAALYSGPDGEDVSVTRTCTDVAGNIGSGSAGFDYDNTDPEVTATPSRGPDSNGWYNHAFSVSYSGEDETSGIDSCDADDEYDGSDTAGDSLSGSCSDVAGNSASASYPFKYDATAPTVSATPSRSPDHNGWYNAPFSVSYSGEDEASGIDSCDADDEYDGPDTAGDSLSGSCSDVAGNSASASYAFKYDATAPGVTVNLARDPDHNAWYNHGLGYRAVGSDALSGLDSCQAGAVYTAPDSAAASVTRTCTDNAGNEGSGSRTFMFDATAPSVTVDLARDPDRNGWYNAPVGYSAAGSDDTSGLDSCQADPVYSGPDGEPVTVTRTCTDTAGNEGVGARSFDYDATAPTITATLSPPANSNGWNKTDVTVSFTCNDNLSGIDPSYGCPVDQLLSSQGLHTLHVATSDVAGNVLTPSFDVRIDKTNPVISGSASPAANSHGWNNTNVVVSFSCFDGLSGLEFCEPDHTLSSNGAGQSVTGDAKDKADNEASATVSGINIDKLAPDVSVTGVANGATYTQGSVPAASCSTTDQPGLSGVDTPASVSVSGPASGVGSFTATCSGATDRAGNSASASVTYNVIYNWTGFFQPIDNNPDQSGNPALAAAWNSAKAGQAIPVKFSLHGDQGLSIFATGYPKSTKVTCPSASSAPDPIETYASSTSGLHYDAASDEYNYVWKTTSTLANTCQRLEVKLVDGTSHYAFFRFVK
jgi:hypothetical protein